MRSKISSGGAFLVLAAIPAAFLSIAACSTTAESAPPMDRASGMCTADQVGEFAGLDATQEIGTRILRATGASNLRWLPKGTIVTMEYRGDRVNVDLDEANKITAVRCG